MKEGAFGANINAACRQRPPLVADATTDKRVLKIDGAFAPKVLV